MYKVIGDFRPWAINNRIGVAKENGKEGEYSVRYGRRHRLRGGTFLGGFLCSADDWKDDGGIDMQRSTGKTKTFSRLSDLQVLSLGTKKKNLEGKRRT